MKLIGKKALITGGNSGIGLVCFDRWRRKRNVINYDNAFVATETEAKQIVAKTEEFVEVVEHWIGRSHPSLKA